MSKTNEGVKETNVSDIGGFDPHDMYSTEEDGATVYHKGTVVTGDIEAAVPRAGTAMPKPIKRGS